MLQLLRRSGEQLDAALEVLDPVGAAELAELGEGAADGARRTPALGQLEVGPERRQIVAGIRAHYTAEQLLGKTIVMVANLEPAMLRGVESQGMLLAVRDGEKVVTLTTDLPTNTGLLVS